GVHHDVSIQQQRCLQLSSPAIRLRDQVSVEEKPPTTIEEYGVLIRKEHAPHRCLHEVLIVRAHPTLRLEPLEMGHRGMVRRHLDLAVFETKHPARAMKFDVFRSGSQRVHQAEARQGIASRSSRPRPQCESTPRIDSTTIPTMSLVVCMRLPACKTRKPMPDSTAIISAATSSSSAVPAPSRRPAKIIGSAEGRITLRMTDQRRAPNATAARTSSGSAWRTPVNVLIAIGKKTPRAMTATLDGSPSPSQRMSSGSSAIFGTGNVAASTGVPTASAAAKKPTVTPTTTPAAAPRAKPSTRRCRL